MEEKKQEERRGYIRERIVPRKNYKRILGYAGAVAGLAVLFGAVAGISFTLSRNAAEKDRTTEREAIVIARDDTSSETENTEKSTTEDPAESTEPLAPETTEPTNGSGGETGETEPSETAEPSSEAPEPSKTSAEHMKEIYEKVENGLAEIAVSGGESRDWLSTQLGGQDEYTGILVAEGAENYFILADGSILSEGSSLTVKLMNEYVPATVQGFDDLTGLMILSVSKSDVSGTPTIVPLGNSFLLNRFEEIFLVGAPFRMAGVVDSGILTYVRGMESVTDGYRQTVFTNIRRAAGTSAFLLNADGEIVGVVTDPLNAGDPTMANGCGISPLKYLIEDLCSGNDTAYLGVRTVTVREEDARIAEVPPGCYIQEVVLGSPAFEAGIQAGDRLVSIEGKTVGKMFSIGSPYFLQLCLDELSPGEETEIRVERKGVEGYEPMALTAVMGGR